MVSLTKKGLGVVDRRIKGETAYLLMMSLHTAMTSLLTQDGRSDYWKP